MKKLLTIINGVVCVPGILIMAYLSWNAMLSSQYMNPFGGEVPIIIPDSVPANILFLALFLVLLFILHKLTDNKLKISDLVAKSVLAFSVLFQIVFGLIHIYAANRPPKGDQLSVYDGVLGFMRGDYSMLRPAEYFGMYPGQLGQAFFEQLILTVFKGTDYHILQVILVLMSAGLVICVYSLIKDLTGNMTLTSIGTLIAGLNFLTIFYDSWIYGDLPSAFLSLAVGSFLVKYHKHKKKTVYLVLAVLTATVSVLLRQNTLIFIIACVIVLLIKGVYDRDKKLLITFFLIIAIPLLAQQMIYKGYEKASGIPHSTGVPVWHHIYIGLTISEGRCGWYSYLPMDYYAHDCDTKETGIAMKEKVMTLLHDTWNTPGYFKTFYSAKVLSQWNEPLFQSIFYNAPHADVNSERLTAFFDQLLTFQFNIFLFIADRIQFILYIGMLIYFILSMKKRPDILEHVLAIALIGGFIFSIIWEAKARYCFPYYVMMMPMAFKGYDMVLKLVFFRKDKK